jgi:hypothetical protein
MKRSGKIEYAFQALKSPKRTYTLWGLVLVLTLSFCVFWFFHGTWMAAPGEHLLGPSNEGLSNYAAALWHIQRDSDYVHFSGMNHPYGEHILFTDNQPILTSWVIWWGRNVADLRTQAVAVINSFQFYSLLVGVAILFLLLRKLHLPVWYAGSVGLGMAMLAPQYAAFDTQFSLSHIWVFPWLLLLLCRYEERMSRRYQSVSLGFWMFVIAQFHFSYFAIGASFLILYTVYHFLYDFSWRNIWRRSSHLIVMIVLPFVCLNIWMHWSDFVVDRPGLTHGFGASAGYWQNIFLPEFLSRRMGGPSATKTYIGLAALLFSLYLLGLWSRKYVVAVANLFVRKEQSWAFPRLFPKTWNDAASHRVHRRYLYGILLSSLLLVVFSLGIPFSAPNMDWTNPYLGSAKQVRGLDRFAWMYFYVSNILLFYVLWNASLRLRTFSENKNKWVKTTMLVLPLLALYVDAWKHQWAERPVTHSFEIQADLQNQSDLQRSQAILPLPYYHIGSDNFWLFPDTSFLERAEMASLANGVPNMGVRLLRTSLWQSLKSLQLVLKPCEVPKILDDIPTNEPISLFVDAKEEQRMRRDHPYLFDVATPTGSGNGWRTFRVQPDSLTASIVRRLDKEIRSIPLQSAVCATCVWESYNDSTKARHIFQGKGALEGIMSKRLELYAGKPFEEAQVLSFWLYADEDARLTHEIHIREGKENVFDAPLHQYVKSIVGGWALIEIPIQGPGESVGTVQIYLQKIGFDLPFTIDELMLRPQGTDQYARRGNCAMKNNYWYKR